MKEKFIKTPMFDVNAPFSIQHAGISYCDGNYKMFRKNQILRALSMLYPYTEP